jgi:PAS domain S-box-containing protein
MGQTHEGIAMSSRIRSWFASIDLNRRILLLVALLAIGTIATTTVMVRHTTRSIVEEAIGDQMIVQARITAHLVAIAEQNGGMKPAEINGHLAEIADFAKRQRGYDYEFWVTDSGGKVYLGTVPVEFTFTADQPQAGEFLRLLEGAPDRRTVVVQESRTREIDSSNFKYVGVAGVDQSRIVEVGYRTDSLLAQLAVQSALQAAGIAGLVLVGAAAAYFILRRLLTAPLNQLIRAARAVEAETYQPGTLAAVTARRDELGHLARVFESTVAKLAARYESLVNVMRSIVLKVRGDGVISFANPYTSELLGFSNEELVGKPLSRILPPEWQDSVQSRLASIGTEEVQANQTNENVSKSGERYWIAWTNRVIREGTGAEREFLCVGNDTTAEMRQRLALQQREEQFRSLLEATPDALIISDEQGQILLVNAQAERVLGYKREELVGQAIEMLVPERIRRSHPQLRQQFHANPDARPMGSGLELAAVRKGGEEFPVEISLSPLKAPDGRSLACSSLRDITQRKRAEVELRQAKAKAEEATKAKSAFLANMSHEIRTPMNGIMGMTELALDTNLTAEQRDYMNTVKSSADALLTIINDILDFSKIEAGRIELDPIDFLLRDSISDTLSPLALRASAKGIELAYEVAPDVPDALIGDVYRLRQVIVNLAGNAIKFTKQGEVVISITQQERSGDEVTLAVSVRDTGIGISPEAAGRLFRAFEQAEASTTRQYGGTGLGLAISKQLVELMGGQIRLESTPGAGSNFIFTVRFKVGAARHSATAEDAARALDGKVALIVDDNETNRRIVSTMLGRWGLRAIESDSAQAALVALDRAGSAGENVSLVITDLHMPDTDGFALARAVRKHPRFSALPIMLLSSSVSSGDQAICDELGIAARLLKPVKQSLLLDNIMRALGGSDRSGAQVPAPAAGASGIQASIRGPLRVLLAEDNPVNQKFAVRVLEGAGHDVTIANNGREAIEHTASGQFDIVLMDVQMPEVDGLEATRAIRAREEGRSRIPIIAMTANAMQGDREMCLEAGMDGYVPKPVKRELLFAEMERVLIGGAQAGGA